MFGSLEDSLQWHHLLIHVLFYNYFPKSVGGTPNSPLGFPSDEFIMDKNDRICLPGQLTTRPFPALWRPLSVGCHLSRCELPFHEAHLARNWERLQANNLEITESCQQPYEWVWKWQKMCFWFKMNYIAVSVLHVNIILINNYIGVTKKVSIII